MNENVHDAILAFEELLDFIEKKPVFDKMSDAGCGYVDTYRSDEFDSLIQKARSALINLKNSL